MVLVEVDVDVVSSELGHSEGYLLVLFLQFLADFLLVGVVVALEGIKYELVVGDGIDGVVGDVVDFSADAL